MSIFTSILVPLDGSAAAAESLVSAIWLATELHARLQVVHATVRPLPADEAFHKLRVPEDYRAQISLHQLDASPDQAIVEAINDLGIDLVVLSAKGQSADSQAQHSHRLDAVGHVAHKVLEECKIPVLLMPPGYSERLPWRSALVPISGETEEDEALNVAVAIAEPLSLELHIAHVVNEGKYGYTQEVQYADSPYHEYAGRLEDMVKRAALGCSPAECRIVIADVSLCKGDVAKELLNLVHSKRIGLIVMGWHGVLVPGHADVIKRLLQNVSCPVLLVRAAPTPSFQLKVGDALE